MRLLQSRRPVAEYIYELREGHVRRKQHAEETMKAKKTNQTKRQKDQARVQTLSRGFSALRMSHLLYVYNRNRYIWNNSVALATIYSFLQECD